MGCKARSIRADASGSGVGSGRGAGNPVTVRMVGETNGIRLIRIPIEWAAKPVQSERMRVGAGWVPDVEPAIR
ncbi:hypothetical protein GCM10010842_11950 [Deinococcus daejeonensis]|uniref:Uncharacterized protein n=1 Tax=Deinococcus daejeonensis TaxID=1007098 RepID=A0ABQ2IZU4_9DEIO|nr:hypothetical protein GCM10010842_11950 [Deinococcus daejeonensis]